MNLLNIKFDFSAAGFALVLIVLLIGVCWHLFQYRQNQLTQFASAELLPKILIPRNDYLFLIKSLGFSLVWLFATIALMQPKGNSALNEKPNPLKSSTGNIEQKQVKRKSHLVIFLIDASASMSVMDSRNGKSRFEYAKEIADEIVRHLNGESAAIFAYTSHLSQLSPPTPDYFFLRLMLRQMQINEGGSSGTDLEKVLKALNQQYLTSPTPDQKTVVWFSDGGDDHLDDLVGDKRNAYIKQLTELITPNKKSPLRILTVGLGTEQGGQIPESLDEGKPVFSKLQPDLLKRFSLIGNGRYYEANSLSTMQLAGDIGKTIDRDSIPSSFDLENQNNEIVANQANEPIYDLYYQVPLGFAILVLGLILFSPDTWIRLRKTDS